MATKSWDCKGCTNLCYMILPDGSVGKYCRCIYDQPDHKGTKWFGDEVRCLDYTTDPDAEDKQIRIWHEPKYIKPLSRKWMNDNDRL